jgi:hypothetical protein
MSRVISRRKLLSTGTKDRSGRDSAARSCAIATNDFEIEPISNNVCGLTLMPALTSANPYCELWTNEKYSRPKKFDYPKDWEAYTGHFHSDSPWYGSTRIVIRKGQLLLGGDQPLAPLEAHVFRPADDPSDADRVTFDMFANGQAMRMNYSGIDFFRAFTS